MGQNTTRMMVWTLRLTVPAAFGECAVKIGIVQRDDTRDVLASSGTLYFMADALERHVGEVVHLGPDTSLTSKALLRGGQVVNRLAQLTLRRRLSPIHQRLLSLHAARLFAPRIAKAGCDALFAPFASVEIAALPTSLPIVYHSDMTWADAVDYYTIYTSLFGFARAEGERIQQAALDKATASVFPSAWAAQTAIEHYGIDAARVSVAPYGANFKPDAIPSREAALRHTLKDGVHLLWIGVSWERKGGAIAHACLTELLSRGVDARLVVCGCQPPAEFQHERLTVVPFLNKNDPGQRAELSQLFLKANFFLFPTATEALGIVLCEASAHGLPSLVRHTGGVGSVITEGMNGYLLPPEAPGSAYAQKVLELCDDPAAYEKLIHSSRQAFEERLNWDAWGRAVKPIFERVTLR